MPQGHQAPQLLRCMAVSKQIVAEHVAGGASRQHWYDAFAEVATSIDVLCGAIQDSSLSVRMSVASAIANISDALQQQQQQPQEELMLQLTKLATGAVNCFCTH